MMNFTWLGSFIVANFKFPDSNFDDIFIFPSSNSFCFYKLAYIQNYNISYNIRLIIIHFQHSINSTLSMSMCTLLRAPFSALTKLDNFTSKLVQTPSQSKLPYIYISTCSSFDFPRFFDPFCEEFDDIPIFLHFHHHFFEFSENDFALQWYFWVSRFWFWALCTIF